jgi:hypothetical protein
VWTAPVSAQEMIVLGALRMRFPSPGVPPEDALTWSQATVTRPSTIPR